MGIKQELRRQFNLIPSLLPLSHDTQNTALPFLPALSDADDPQAGQPEPNQQVAPGSLRAPPSPPALQESTALLYSRLLRPLFRLLSPPFCASLNVHKGLFWGGGHSIGGQAEEGGARGSRSLCLTEQMGASASPA